MATPTDKSTPLPAPNPDATRKFFAGIQDENGVDLTLIRENLRLSPRERLIKAELARLQAVRLRSHAKRIYPPAA